MTDDWGDLTESEQRFLREAAEYLENPRFLMRVANLVGRPAEVLLNRLPASAQTAISETTHAALETALRWAVKSLPQASELRAADASLPPVQGASPKRLERHLHTAVAATTGAVGGFFGFAGMTVEVPTTTTVMLRSIAGIAREEGFSLDDPLTQLHCLAVLSLGSQRLDTMESAYLTSRLGLALALREAATFLAKHSAGEVAQALSRGTAPVLVRLLNAIAARFQIVISQKMAAQSVPLAGAAMGALINAAFTDHFNRVARYHFGIVRLERKHGAELVQGVYRRLAGEQPMMISD